MRRMTFGVMMTRNMLRERVDRTKRKKKIKELTSIPNKKRMEAEKNLETKGGTAGHSLGSTTKSSTG